MGRGARERRGSWLGRLEGQLRRLVGPAQLGRSDEPDAERRRAAQAHRDAHAAAFEVVVDSNGRRYVRARSADPRGGGGDAAGGGADEGR
ncbi:hypothetical protein [uncultured Pseudokineococcus sp.]|uniref:hypothetical protein n=1 Tax=uncultured Pseudokineococcus sp. TaxID=1642928 RepID=UPI0026374F3D|nr:hypothetical protein [uncultured Pseudokineococcus sp.]